MHILLVADGRSPTARHWLDGLLAAGQRVTLVSTFPCQPPPGVEKLILLPVAFSRAAPELKPGSLGERPPFSRRLVQRFRPLLLSGRYWLGPLSVRRWQRRFRRMVESEQPDLVHALRIPFEGMLAAATPPGVPLIVSTWGNDLTLHARGSAWMSALTRACLRRADGLISDTLRDLRLAKDWGFYAEKPTLSVPGSGGIDLRALTAAMSITGHPLLDKIPDGEWVVNPRGFRPGSVHNDVFFRAIPAVLARRPDARFICPAMAGQAEALAWVRELGIEASVHLLPTLDQPALWQLFHRARVFVSPSSHDGTPNSLLEAMACGCFPVAGDIESLREWIIPGENGLLVAPRDAQALADAITLALENDDLRRSAAETNNQIIARRAEVHAVRERVAAFYRYVVENRILSTN